MEKSQSESKKFHAIDVGLYRTGISTVTVCTRSRMGDAKLKCGFPYSSFWRLAYGFPYQYIVTYSTGSRTVDTSVNLAEVGALFTTVLTHFCRIADTSLQ